MLQGHHLSVFGARDRAEFKREVIGFAENLGFDRIGAITVLDRADGQSDFISIDNAPEAYRSSSQFDDAARRDPVMQHCRTQSLPIVWNQSTYVKSGVADKWDHQAPYGYAHGIAVAMHLPQGLHFMVGVDRDQALPEDAVEIHRLTAELQLFTVHAQDAALRILRPELMPSADEASQLTRRELECLRWTMAGKTAWELARILSIAEHTVTRHLHNASHKLGCTSKHQAVMRALRLGLIW